MSVPSFRLLPGLVPWTLNWSTHPPRVAKMEGRNDPDPEMCSSPIDDGPSSSNQLDQAMGSMTTSPTSTTATTATDSATPDRANTPKKGRRLADRKADTASTDTSASSSRQQTVHKQSSQQQQDQTPTSGDPRPRRRQNTTSHRNSSFEYKETLDATTKHLEVGFRRGAAC